MSASRPAASRSEAPPPAALDQPSPPAGLLRTAAILVVDDEPGMRNFLHRALEHECALLEVADCVESAEELRRRCHFDLLIVDIRLPGLSGVEWLEQLRGLGVSTDVIFISAFADVEMAVAALRAGAADFILKPFRMEQMMNAVARCLERRAMQRENALLRRQLAPLPSVDGIVGESELMRDTCRVLERIAPASATVLVEGETGTGKELVARAIHKLSGRRGAFVPVNCGSISAELLESELFGHTRGAFTGAQSAREGLFVFAHEGTLFLDEISELPLAMQSKLLRVLESNSVRPVGADREVPVDARVIAATNRNLAGEVARGAFREDLYYRLNVLSIRVPALRERLEDVPLLAEHFNRSVAADLGLQPIPLSHRDTAQMQDYTWPGNVRELRNVIERSLLLGKLPGDCCRETASGGADTREAAGFPVDWPLAEVEKRHMLSVLAHVGGNKSEAARRLGVSRKTMERKLRGWGLMNNGPAA